MNRLTSRSGLTVLGLLGISVLVLVAAVTAPGAPSSSDPAMAADDSRPCLYIFDLAARDSRLVWFFGETKVPRGLVEASSGVVPYCEAGFSAESGEADYDLAVTFAFTEGTDSAHEEVVWWLFYPPWDDPGRWGERLSRNSGGALPSYHDGYIVAVSPLASDEMRHAATSVPDLDAWTMWVERAGVGR